ncbi:MAG: hypothetical protein EP335_07050 [Alphaproteobacteria bacterium]|nr:MAG: hypothetical protein EP335_07050 [Alphaproteobacteria bacterium]
MNKRFRRIVLHIGAEKTGSTSIQAFLAANRGALLKAGFLFPASLGETNQPAIAAMAQADKADRNLMMLAGVRPDESIEDFRARTRTGFDAECAKWPDAHSLVLTNEHGHSRIRTPDDAARLAGFLQTLSDHVTVIFYIRRQDLAAASLYTTALKMGHTDTGPVMPTDAPVPYYNYWRLTRLYEDALGPGLMPAGVTVRLFDRAHMLDGDLIADFLMAAGLPADGWVRPDAQNQSLNPVAQRFLMAFNRKRRERFGQDVDRYRKHLMLALDRLHAGRGLMPPRALAMAFQAQYAASNEKLRARYFPDYAAPLFGDDFSMYEDRDGDWMPTVTQALDIGADLWVHQERRVDALKREIKRLKDELEKKS